MNTSTLIGFLPIAGLGIGAIVYFLLPMIKSKSAVANAEHDLIQTATVEKIKEINMQQETLAKEILEKEHVAEEAQGRLQKIIAKTNNEVIAITKEAIEGKGGTVKRRFLSKWAS